MKNTKKVIGLLVSIGLILVSCGSDDSDDPTGLSTIQNATEDVALPLATLESGITIEGGEKITGAAPTPNSTLEFTLENTQQEAFQKTGLDINFSSSEDIAGAFIQFKDVDGNKSESYFDIPASAFNNESDLGRKKLNTSKSKLKSAKIISQNFVEEDLMNTINIDFGTVPAGKFCYDICLYDSDNNIYVLQEVCVTVEAWGGNDAIVGSWIFDREEGGREDEGKVNAMCQNGSSITVDAEMNIKDDWEFNLNANGIYFEVYDEEYKNLDFMKTEEQCEAVYLEESEFFKGQYSGNWAYNEDNNTLTVIDFSFEDFLNPDENENFEEGELYFEGVKAEIVNGQLVLTDIDEIDGRKVFFNRK